MQCKLGGLLCVGALPVVARGVWVLRGVHIRFKQFHVYGLWNLGGMSPGKSSSTVEVQGTNPTHCNRAQCTQYDQYAVLVANTLFLGH
jgi:hypothetical protein